MNFYVTTPIYYVNATPHIGHAYTTILADVLARYHRLWGDSVVMLTGTDEHGQKVQSAAKARGLDPQAHCDEMMLGFEKAWQDLDIAPDIFMRTTFPFHREVVQRCLQDLFDRGEIYAQDYEGWYSVSEEIFYTEKDLVDGRSPAGKEVQKITERNYFFRMSKYQQQLIDYINKNPDFIQPAGKRSEVLGFLQQPLGDLCISRPKSRLSWGIEIPFDKDYVTYVWFDALLNYVSALGYGQGPERQANFDRYWKEAIHLIGKDILITHTVYWPTMLMALGMPLPKMIFAHGWWLNALGGKMSKSEGPVVDPLSMRESVGVDALRYFLCREIQLGNDAQFSPEILVNRVNAELANNLGNLFSRSVNLVIKYFNGALPERAATHPATGELEALARKTPAVVRERIGELDIAGAIGGVIDLLNATNKYLDVIAPWKTAKENLPLAGESLYAALENVRIAAVLLTPVMPTKMAALLGSLGISAPATFEDAARFGALPAGLRLEKPAPLFPRAEIPA
ncbi:MAG: Methionine--tRNA ligase [Pseudomonadota bacterium]|jgi:methionyl-tRNA synthetase